MKSKWEDAAFSDTFSGPISALLHKSYEEKIAQQLKSQKNVSQMLKDSNKELD